MIAQELLDAIEASEPPAQMRVRDALGPSDLRSRCDRAVWYAHHWFGWITHPKERIRSLFNRGHREEPAIYERLRSAGVKFAPGGAQKTIELHPHLAGHCDGIVYNVPGINPKAQLVLEIKTHSLKSFKTLQSRGVKLAKPEHHTQSNLYAGGLGLRGYLYVAVCKDNDELHAELIKFNEDDFEKDARRALTIIESNEPPRRISPDRDSFSCRFCDHKHGCFNGWDDTDVTTERNCRTCIHSMPDLDSGHWWCNAVDDILGIEAQRKGCPQWECRD